MPPLTPSLIFSSKPSLSQASLNAHAALDPVPEIQNPSDLCSSVRTDVTYELAFTSSLNCM